MNKATERLAIEQLPACYVEFPNGRIVDSESPDFLVDDGSRKVGIEIIDFVAGQGKTGSPARHQEQLRERMAATAGEIFEGQTNQLLLVWLHFVPGLQLTKESVPLLAESLASRIAEAVAAQGKGAALTMDDLEGTELDGVLISAKVSKAEMTEGRWFSVEAGFLSSEMDELKNALAMKEPKRDAYLKKCDEVWLLIVATGGRLSSTFNASRLEYQAKLDESKFDRVIFFDPSEAKVIRLV